MSIEKCELRMRKIFLPLEIRLTTAPVEIELEVERVRHLRYMRAIENRKEAKGKTRSVVSTLSDQMATKLGNNLLGTYRSDSGWSRCRYGVHGRNCDDARSGAHM